MFMDRDENWQKKEANIQPSWMKCAQLRIYYMALGDIFFPDTPGSPILPAWVANHNT